jgi:hypothetical protein
VRKMSRAVLWFHNFVWHDMIACMQSLTEVLFRLIVTDADGIRDGLEWDEDDGASKHVEVWR